MNGAANNRDSSESEAEPPPQGYDFWRPRFPEDQAVPSEPLWLGFKFHWIKVLGKGGWGIATLWEVEFDDGHRMPVVIKMDKSSFRDHSFRAEREWHERYQGASHIIQSIDLNALADKHRRRGWFRRGKRFDPDKLNVVVLEYAHHGTLSHLLTKASYYNIGFSNKVLWQIWGCLVEGVAEVAYQKAFREKYKLNFGEMLSKAVLVNKADVFFNRLASLEISHDIHTDLDHSNVLAVHDSSHGANPVFKLHDFGGGWSVDMRLVWDNMDYKYMSSLRLAAKPSLTLPEQISEEWSRLADQLASNPADYMGENPRLGFNVAGRFGSWSNVFMIGRIMESAITLQYAAPLAQGKIYKRKITYCRRLLRSDYQDVDPELVDVIAKCLYHVPRYRPSTIDLLKQVVARRRRGFPEESDAETAEFWRRFLQPLPEMNMEEEPGYPETPEPPSVPDDQAVEPEASRVRQENQGNPYLLNPPTEFRSIDRLKPSARGKAAILRKSVQTYTGRLTGPNVALNNLFRRKKRLDEIAKARRAAQSSRARPLDALRGGSAQAAPPK